MKIVLALFLVPTLLPTLAQARTPSVVTRVVLTPGRLHAATLTMDGFSPSRTPGQPALPELEVAVALHPHAVLSSLELQVKSGPTDSLPARRALEPNPPYRVLIRGQVTESWLGAGTVLAGRDLDIYGGDSHTIFPRTVIARGRITDRRGLRVLHLAYRPLRYRHRSRELLLDRHTEVRLRYSVSSDAPLKPDPQLLPFLRRVANVDQARVWHRAALADVATPRGYVIVIPDKLRQASQKLVAFIKQKEGFGMKVHVVTDTDLASIAVGPMGGDAERIRTWLTNNYQQLNLSHVLLVGNPDPKRAGVPMKLTYAMINGKTYKITPPSDHYYADLTGNWDLDGDGKVAEFPDDDGDGGVDFTPEVQVGRIPVYDDNVTALDQILDKTMRYAAETGDRAWRRRVLQPAAMLFYKDQYDQPHYRMDGADMADAIWDQVIKPRGLTRYTLYEAAGVDPSKLTCDAALSTENVVAEWKKGYGIVTWFGHGSAEGVYRSVWANDDGNGIPDYDEMASPAFFTYDDTVQLDDTRPAFVFHGSCSNGSPEEADNVGYGLLRHGAIGTVSSSREAVVLFQTGSIDLASANIFGLERDFTDGLLQNMPAGDALFWAKEKLSLKLGMYSWLARLQVNLYGDPSVALTNCAADADCDDGKMCNGQELCQGGQCTSGTPVSCASGDPCQGAACDEATGRCTVAPRPDGEACDDDKFCTVDDACIKGVCKGAPRCAAPGNPCVEAKCDEAKLTCDVYPRLEGQTCHEGSDREGKCTGGVCEPDGGGCRVGRGGGGLAVSLLFLLFIWLHRRRRFEP